MIVFIWFAFARDRELLPLSIESVKLTMARAREDFEILVIDDEGDSIGPEMRARAEEMGAQVISSSFPRGEHLDGGGDCFLGMLDSYVRAVKLFPRADYVCKVDCDMLLCNAARFLARLEQGFAVVGTGGSWRGFPGMWGCYFLGASLVRAIERRLADGRQGVLELAAEEARRWPSLVQELPPDYPEDQALVQLVTAIAGQGALYLGPMTDKFLGLWSAKRGEFVADLVFAYDFVHFGCRGIVGLDRAMRRVRGGMEEGLEVLIGRDRERPGGGRSWISQKRLVLGVGPGRCGTMTFAEQMGQQAGVWSAHEAFRPLPWHVCPENRGRFLFASDRLSRLLELAPEGGIVVDVGWYWLPWIEELRGVFPEVIRFVYLSRDPGEIVRSFRDKGREFEILKELRREPDGGTVNDLRSPRPRYGKRSNDGLRLRRWVAECERIWESKLAGRADAVRIELEEQNDPRAMVDLMAGLGVRDPVFRPGIWENEGETVRVSVAEAKSRAARASARGAA